MSTSRVAIRNSISELEIEHSNLIEGASLGDDLTTW